MLLNSSKADISLLSYDLLWHKDNSGTNNFGACTVSVDCSQYNFVIVKYKNRYQSNDVGVLDSDFPGYNTVIVPVDGDWYQMFCKSTDVNCYDFTRYVKVTNTDISFSVSYWQSNTTSGKPSAGNDVCVPISVYGIKSL